MFDPKKSQIVDSPDEVKWFYNFEKYDMAKPILSFKRNEEDVIYHFVSDESSIVLLVPMYRDGKQVGYHASCWWFPAALDAAKNLKL